jgi:hypothetical protein
MHATTLRSRSAWSLALLTGCIVRGHIGESREDDASSESSSSVDDAASATAEGSESSTADAAQREPQSDAPDDDSTTADDASGTMAFDLGAPDVASDTTGDPTVGAVDCCTPSEAPGCHEAGAEACVCALDPYCCDVAWDDACVEVATWSDCAACLVPEPPRPEDCCRGLGGHGCADEYVQDCVCAIDPYCCDVAWDEYCVEQVDLHGCGACARQ